MKLKELTPEQIRTWTLEQKDQWWLDHVYQGDLPQLTLRAALTGMVLGSVLSLTNLYVGIKTGWSLGVGISSVILSFSIFKLWAKLKIGAPMSLLENNAMQSVATSAGYMTAPLISAIPAYMLVTQTLIPIEHTLIWIILLALLGVLYAFPLKKRFINEEQLPFPEGYAAAVVMLNLHADLDPDQDPSHSEGSFKAKLLALGAGVSALFEVLRNQIAMQKMHLGFLKIPDYFDEFIYAWATPRILGSPLKDLTVRLETSLVMIGAGGLIGIVTGSSLILGALTNYCLLAPYLIRQGIIAHANFKEITMWALWFGSAMMTSASLYAFFSKPQIFQKAFGSLFQKKKSKIDVLAAIELPLRVSLIGVPVIGALVIYFGHRFFHFGYFEGIIALPLVFIFTLIAVTSTGLTSVTPGGALGKLTQLTYSVISPGNVPTNIMAAGINSEVALNTSNLLMDIKPGYLLGAKPRQQAVGHVLGIFAGAVTVVPVYYALFHGQINLLTSEQLPLPGAMIWRAVAEALTKGLSALHPTAQYAALIGIGLGITSEVIKQKTKGAFKFSAVGFGLAFVLRFTDSLAMALGAFLVWYFSRRYPKPGSLGHRIWNENSETICAGIIAGGSIIGIILILIETMA